MLWPGEPRAQPRSWLGSGDTQDSQDFTGKSGQAAPERQAELRFLDPTHRNPDPFQKEGSSARETNPEIAFYFCKILLLSGLIVL